MRCKITKSISSDIELSQIEPSEYDYIKTTHFTRQFGNTDAYVLSVGGLPVKISHEKFNRAKEKGFLELLPDKPEGGEMSNNVRIHQALLGVMQDIGAIAKNRKNPQQGYNFRGIDDVYNNLQPALIKNKVVIIPRLSEIQREERETRSGSTMIYTSVKGAYDFISAEDGSKVTAETFGEGMDTSDKSTNKAMSAALKYAIIQTLAIPTEELIDSEQDHIEPKAKQPKPQKTSPADMLKALKKELLAKAQASFGDNKQYALEFIAWCRELKKHEEWTIALLQETIENFDELRGAYDERDLPL